MVQLLLGVVASAYLLSLPFAGWLVWEAGRVRRETDEARDPGLRL